MSPPNNTDTYNTENYSGNNILLDGFTPNKIFASSVPSKYVFKNKKGLLVHFSIFDFDSSEVVVNKLTNVLLRKVKYNCIVKVRYNRDSFFMAGSQFGFEFNSYNDILALISLIKLRIEEYLEQYKLPSNNIDYIQLNFRTLDEKFFSEFLIFFFIKPDDISSTNFSKLRTDLFIPVSLSPLADPLNVQYTNDIISDVPVVINGVKSWITI